MAAGMTKRDKFHTYNTLVCLIQAIEGRQTTIDLRGECSVTGIIVQCDSGMNILLRHVLYRDQTGAPIIVDNMMIKSRLIRYVHIPADVDIKAAMTNYLDRLSGINTHQAPKKHSFKQTRLLRRQAETMEEVQRIKMERSEEQQ